MKTPSINHIRKYLAPAGLAVALLGATGSAWAVGTAAGTNIKNTATLSYTVGSSTTATKTSTEANFKVDRKINLKVTALDSTAKDAQPGTTAITKFKVENLGNDTQDFKLDISTLLDAMQTTSGDAFNNGATTAPEFSNANFSATACKVQVKTFGSNEAFSSTNLTGSDGVVESTPIVNLQPSENDSSLPSTNNTNGGAYVQVSCTMPDTGLSNGDTVVIGLGATAKVKNTSAATAVTENTQDSDGLFTVFGDPAGRVGADNTRDARHSARNAYKIISATVSVKKEEAVVCDPYNQSTNPRRIPGAIVRYTVTVKNDATAGANAKLSNFKDHLDKNLEMVTDNYTATTGKLSTCTTFGTALGNAATNAPLSIACTDGSPARASCSAPAGSASLATYTGGDTTKGQTLTVTYNSNTITTMPAVTGQSGSNVNAEKGELRPGETVTTNFYVRIK